MTSRKSLRRVSVFVLVAFVASLAAPILEAASSAPVIRLKVPGQNVVFDINTANADMFQKLPGIGPVTAKAIVQYRAQHGAFSSLEALKDVPGLGASRFRVLQTTRAPVGTPPDDPFGVLARFRAQQNTAAQGSGTNLPVDNAVGDAPAAKTAPKAPRSAVAAKAAPTPADQPKLWLKSGDRRVNINNPNSDYVLKRLASMGLGDGEVNAVMASRYMDGKLVPVRTVAELQTRMAAKGFGAQFLDPAGRYVPRPQQASVAAQPSTEVKVTIPATAKDALVYAKGSRLMVRITDSEGSVAQVNLNQKGAAALYRSLRNAGVSEDMAVQISRARAQGPFKGSSDLAQRAPRSTELIRGSASVQVPGEKVQTAAAGDQTKGPAAPSLSAKDLQIKQADASVTKLVEQYKRVALRTPSSEQGFARTLKSLADTKVALNKALVERAQIDGDPAAVAKDTRLAQIDSRVKAVESARASFRARQLLGQARARINSEVSGASRTAKELVAKAPQPDTVGSADKQINSLKRAYDGLYKGLQAREELEGRGVDRVKLTQDPRLQSLAKAIEQTRAQRAELVKPKVAPKLAQEKAAEPVKGRGPAEPSSSKDASRVAKGPAAPEDSAVSKGMNVKAAGAKALTAAMDREAVVRTKIDARMAKILQSGKYKSAEEVYKASQDPRARGDLKKLSNSIKELRGLRAAQEPGQSGETRAPVKAAAADETGKPGAVREPLKVAAAKGAAAVENGPSAPVSREAALRAQISDRMTKILGTGKYSSPEEVYKASQDPAATGEIKALGASIDELRMLRRGSSAPVEETAKGTANAGVAGEKSGGAVLGELQPQTPADGAGNAGDTAAASDGAASGDTPANAAAGDTAANAGANTTVKVPDAAVPVAPADHGAAPVNPQPPREQVAVPKEAVPVAPAAPAAPDTQAVAPSAPAPAPEAPADATAPVKAGVGEVAAAGEGAGTHAPPPAAPETQPVAPAAHEAPAPAPAPEAPAPAVAPAEPDAPAAPAAPAAPESNAGAITDAGAVAGGGTAPVAATAGGVPGGAQPVEAPVPGPAQPADTGGVPAVRPVAAPAPEAVAQVEPPATGGGSTAAAASQTLANGGAPAAANAGPDTVAPVAETNPVPTEPADAGANPAPVRAGVQGFLDKIMQASDLKTFKTVDPNAGNYADEYLKTLTGKSVEHPAVPGSFADRLNNLFNNSSAPAPDAAATNKGWWSKFESTIRGFGGTADQPASGDQAASAGGGSGTAPSDSAAAGQPAVQPAGVDAPTADASVVRENELTLQAKDITTRLLNQGNYNTVNDVNTAAADPNAAGDLGRLHDINQEISDLQAVRRAGSGDVTGALPSAPSDSGAVDPASDPAAVASKTNPFAAGGNSAAGSGGFGQKLMNWFSGKGFETNAQLADAQSGNAADAGAGGDPAARGGPAASDGSTPQAASAADTSNDPFASKTNTAGSAGAAGASGGFGQKLMNWLSGKGFHTNADIQAAKAAATDGAPPESTASNPGDSSSAPADPKAKQLDNLNGQLKDARANLHDLTQSQSDATGQSIDQTNASADQPGATGKAADIKAAGDQVTDLNTQKQALSNDIQNAPPRSPQQIAQDSAGGGSAPAPSDGGPGSSAGGGPAAPSGGDAGGGGAGGGPAAPAGGGAGGGGAAAPTGGGASDAGAAGGGGAGAASGGGGAASGAGAGGGGVRVSAPSDAGAAAGGGVAAPSGGSAGAGAGAAPVAPANGGAAPAAPANAGAGAGAAGGGAGISAPGGAGAGETAAGGAGGAGAAGSGNAVNPAAAGTARTAPAVTGPATDALSSLQLRQAEISNQISALQGQTGGFKGLVRRFFFMQNPSSDIQKLQNEYDQNAVKIKDLQSNPDDLAKANADWQANPKIQKANARLSNLISSYQNALKGTDPNSSYGKALQQKIDELQQTTPESFAKSTFTMFAVAAGTNILLSLGRQAANGQKLDIGSALKSVVSPGFLVGTAGMAVGAWAGTQLAMMPAVALMLTRVGSFLPGPLGIMVGLLPAFLGGALGGALGGMITGQKPDWALILTQTLGSALGTALSIAFFPGLGLIGQIAGGMAGAWIAEKILNMLRGGNPTSVANGAGSQAGNGNPSTLPTGGAAGAATTFSAQDVTDAFSAMTAAYNQYVQAEQGGQLAQAASSYQDYITAKHKLDSYRVASAGGTQPTTSAADNASLPTSVPTTTAASN